MTTVGDKLRVGEGETPASALFFAILSGATLYYALFLGGAPDLITFGLPILGGITAIWSGEALPLEWRAFLISTFLGWLSHHVIYGGILI